jgi:hypothetical protein
MMGRQRRQTGNIFRTNLVPIGLQLLLNGQPIADSFDYTVTDGNGGWDVASVSLTVDTLL